MPVKKKKKRCAAKTKAGKRCKLMAKAPSKFCHLHKGKKAAKKKTTKKKTTKKKATRKKKRR